MNVRHYADEDIYECFVGREKNSYQEVYQPTANTSFEEPVSGKNHLSRSGRSELFMCSASPNGGAF